MRATVSAFIDRYHPKQHTDDSKPKEPGKCSVSIRVTSQRKRKYYPTGIDLTAKDFDRIMEAKRRSEADNKIYDKIRSAETKATNIVDKLKFFTFLEFEKLYVENRGATDSLSYWFDKYIEELKENGQVGTATGYECAKNSLEKFKPGLKFADVTQAMLKKYENWMLEEQHNSKTTVSMYVRCMRCLFNLAGIDGAMYPFSRKQKEKGKYRIPKSRNIKKALSIEEVHRIYHFNVENNSSMERARDYWYFIYLTNGINVKDLCLLKYKNIEKGDEGDFVKFERAKTKDTQEVETIIKASLKPAAKAIIKKWGQKTVNQEAYIFPHLRAGLSPVKERQIVQQVTKLINKYVKKIAKEVKITKPVTSYYARHSFATILRNSGASIEFISEALGHSDIRTTKNYLDSFGEKAIHRTTDALTAFAK